MKLLAGPAEGAVAVTVTSLEMHDRGAVVAAPAPTGASWRRVDASSVGDAAVAGLSRDFYRDVGGPWHWVDRRDWSDAQWQAWTGRPGHHLLVCARDGIDAGYAELEEQDGGDVEIAYFGLLPGFLGAGLGRWWLATVLEQAWEITGTRRVWVHTCSLDGPGALPTYRGRGLSEFAREVEWRLPVDDHGLLG